MTVEMVNVKTARLDPQCFYTFGPEDGIPVVLIHGNLSTGRFYEHLAKFTPPGVRFIMPDMRGSTSGNRRHTWPSRLVR